MGPHFDVFGISDIRSTKIFPVFYRSRWYCIPMLLDKKISPELQLSLELSKFLPACFPSKMQYLLFSLFIHTLVLTKINIKLSPNFWIQIFHNRWSSCQSSIPDHLNTSSDNCPIIDVKTPKSSRFSTVSVPCKMQYLLSSLFIHALVHSKIDFMLSLNFW